MAIMEAIATTYLEADASSVTFSSIPATYEHLQLRTTGRAASTSRSGQEIRFNGDTGSNYNWQRMQSYGSSTAAGIWTGSNYLHGPYGTGNDADSAEYAGNVVDILDYANTNKNTSMQYFSGVFGTPDIFFGGGVWDSTVAVNTILLYSASYTFVRGTSFTLYGIKSS